MSYNLKYRPNQFMTLTERTNLHLLENRELVRENRRFLGCTLWTDYQLFGGDKKPCAIDEPQRSMIDYQCIGLAEEYHYRKLRPADTIQFHQQSCKFLVSKFQEPFHGKTVVITHHAPSLRSLTPYFKEDLNSAAFWTDLEDLSTQYSPDFWIHGHIHPCLDYTIGRTRILVIPEDTLSMRRGGNKFRLIVWLRSKPLDSIWKSHECRE